MLPFRGALGRGCLHLGLGSWWTSKAYGGRRPVIKLNSSYAIKVPEVSWGLRDDKNCPFLFRFSAGAFDYVLDVFPLVQEELAAEGILWVDR